MRVGCNQRRKKKRYEMKKKAWEMEIVVESKNWKGKNRRRGARNEDGREGMEKERKKERKKGWMVKGMSNKELRTVQNSKVIISVFSFRKRDCLQPG